MKNIKRILSTLLTSAFIVTSAFSMPLADINAMTYNKSITSTDEMMLINLNALTDYKPLNATQTTTAPVTTTTLKTTTTTVTKATQTTTSATNTTTLPKVTTTTTATTPSKTTSKPLITTHTGFDVFGIYDAYHSFKCTTTTTTPVWNGIDVSKWQDVINWTEVKNSGMDFAIIRSGYGNLLSQEDPKFRTNMEQAQKLGIPCGTYWFSYATTVEDAYREAETCYQVIKDFKFEYPVFFDIETKAQRDECSEATVSGIIEAFCSTLEAKGYYVGLYSYASFLNTKVYAQTLSKYDVWVAHYTDKSSPDYKRPHGMWQYTDNGSVKGINGNVDMNYSYKDYPKIIKNNKLNGF
jgi:GH25 family lysozyme M1 (1,4-beta-N-acetylmuramidase)